MAVLRGNSLGLSGDLALLPATSFIAFDAMALTQAKILWVRDGVDEQHILRECGFAIPLPGDSGSAYGANSKTFYADRYGGQGLGYNGGGARCGAAGAFQLKGIGQNALGASKSGYFHSYGGATLFEVILETLWGEICQMALPFGGALTHAAIDTGTKAPIKFPKEGGPTHTVRALAVRDASLRPAHFMRAIYFRGDALGNGAVLDGERTRSAIFGLSEILNGLFNLLPKGELPPHQRPTKENVELLISEMLRRHAMQLACARARRIMHGSLTSSNITVNGGWIDYGSISTVSDYGPVHIPRGAPHFMKEEALIHETLNDLSFYLNKYLGFQLAGSKLSSEVLWEKFEVEFRHHQVIEFLVLIGMPRRFATEHIASAACVEMYRLISKVVARNQSAPFTILSSDNNMVQTMPPAFGRYPLNPLIRAVVCAQNLVEAMEVARHVLPDAVLADDFAAAYYKLILLLSSTYQQDINGSYVEAARVNSLRLNTDCLQLYRTILYPRIEGIVEANEDVNDFVKGLLGVATAHLADCDIGLPLKIQGRCISYEEGYFVHGVRCKFSKAGELAASVAEWCSA